MENWLALAARREPDRVAIEFAGEREPPVTYTQLHSAARSTAERMRAGGLFPGARALLDGGDQLRFATELHATQMLGAVAMPIDPRLNERERAQRETTEFAPAPGTATMMFTSGTTAHPKPVYLTRSNWEANAIGSALALGLDLQERWLCAMPLAHVGGLSILLRSTLYATTVVLHQRFDAERVLEDLMNPERRITLVSLVPTMLARLLDAGLQRPPTLRWVLLGGGPIPAALLERAAAAGVPVAPSYGLTETCSQLVTFGLPLLGAELKFEGGQSEAEGEIVVRGPSVAPLCTDDDGWLRTGDLGQLDPDGRLLVTGRKSETIVTGGENVSPSEVEGILAAHPAVADVAVHAITDPEWGEAVAARVVLRPGHSASAQELTEFAREHLTGFKVPKQITFVQSLPRTTSGKLLRRRLTSNDPEVGDDTDV